MATTLLDTNEGALLEGETNLDCWRARPGGVVRGRYSNTPAFIVLWNLPDPTNVRWRKLGVLRMDGVHSFVFLSHDDDKSWVLVRREGP